VLEVFWFGLGFVAGIFTGTILYHMFWAKEEEMRNHILKEIFKELEKKSKERERRSEKSEGGDTFEGRGDEHEAEA